MDFKPLEDRIILRKIEAKEQSQGGVLLPSTVDQEPMEGVVVAIGPGAIDKNGDVIEPVVAMGDRVLYGKWGIKDIIIDKEDYAVMREGDIIGILTEA